MKKLLHTLLITILFCTGAVAQNYNQNINFTRITQLSGYVQVSDTVFTLVNDGDTTRIFTRGDSCQIISTAGTMYISPGISGGSVFNVVDTIYRIVGKDSIFYKIDGRTNAIKDSVNQVVFTNGLTKTNDTTRWGGSVAIGTEIYHWFGDSVKYSNKIDNPGGDLATVEWRYDDVENGRNAIINLWHSEVFGLFAAEMGVWDTAANAGSGINVSEAGAGTKWIVTSNVANAAYGAESWTEREETNFYITDNATALDLGRWNIGADSLFQSKGYISGYIYEPSTYTGTANFGNQSVNIDSNGFVFSYKNQSGSYVYANQRLRSNLEIKDSLIFSKPEKGDVFIIDTAGRVALNNLLKLGSLDSVTLYAITPPVGTIAYCNNCTGTGVTGRLVAFFGAAWRRLLFD